MATGNAASGYQGQAGAFEVVQNGLDRYIKVYNDLAAAVNNGDVYILEYVKDADSLDPSARPTLLQPATNTVAREVCVVNNLLLGKTTIADQDWGFVQTSGYCPKVKVAATVAIDDYLDAANGSVEAADGGTTETAKSFAIALTAVASNYCEAVLLPHKRCTV